MVGTMTWVGLDVHARSTYAAAIDAATGELARARFGPGVDAPLEWLRSLLAGSLTAVVVPAPEGEAAGEMTRAHDVCRQELMRARHRVSKMLLRHGVVYPKSKTWTAEHRRWLSQQCFAEPPSETVFADCSPRSTASPRARRRSHLRSHSSLPDERWWPTVSRLRAFRGIDTLTALSIHLELGGDWRRFERATALSAWLGLTPSLNQSGESSRQGAIAKTGSMLARRLLVESAWHYSRQPRLGATLANRQLGQPDHILAIPNRAQQRLYRVNRRMRARGKPHNVTAGARSHEPLSEPHPVSPGRRTIRAIVAPTPR